MNEIIKHIKINWKNYLIAFLAILIFIGPISYNLSNGLMQNGAVFQATDSSRNMQLSKGISSFESASIDNFAGERKKTKTANGQVKTENYDNSKTELQNILEKYETIILSENENKDSKDYRNFYINVKIDSTKLDNLINDIKNLGDVEYLNINSNDVTENYISYKERISRYEKQITTYENKLNKELEVKFEIEIQRRIDELEDSVFYLKKSFEKLEDRIEYSKLSLSLTEKYSIADEINFTSFSDMWKNFLIALNNALDVFITILGFIIPFGIIFLIYRFGIKPFWNRD